MSLSGSFKGVNYILHKFHLFKLSKINKQQKNGRSLCSGSLAFLLASEWLKSSFPWMDEEIAVSFLTQGSMIFIFYFPDLVSDKSDFILNFFSPQFPHL